jgi:hypothetical protein
VLRTVAAQVRDAATGAALAADRTDAFYRLYGDVTGDRLVNAADFVTFRQAFGSASGSPAYVAALDYDGDGLINALDFTQFRPRFGLSLPPP